MALNVVSDSSPGTSEEMGRRYLEKAAMIASAADVRADRVCRYDINITSGIVHTIKEHGVTTVVIGLHEKAGMLDSFFGSLTSSLLRGTYREVIVARLMMPVNTLKGILTVVPPMAEYEVGFSRWLTHLCRMSSQSGCSLKFRADVHTAECLRSSIDNIAPGVMAAMDVVEDMQFGEMMNVSVDAEQMLAVVAARPASVSYDPVFDRLPSLLKNFSSSNLMVIYPEQAERQDVMTFSDPIGNR